MQFSEGGYSNLGPPKKAPAPTIKRHLRAIGNGLIAGLAFGVIVGLFSWLAGIAVGIGMMSAGYLLTHREDPAKAEHEDDPHSAAYKAVFHPKYSGSSTNVFHSKD